jgi:hypothetical protein
MVHGEVMTMEGSQTLNPIFGFFIALGGLALAVWLGTVLYRDEEQEKVSAKKPLKTRDAAKLSGLSPELKLS